MNSLFFGVIGCCLRVPTITRIMSKRRYKEYLRDDTATIPRTTCWRNKQRARFGDVQNMDSNNSVKPAGTNRNDETVQQFDYLSDKEDEILPDDLNTSFYSFEENEENSGDDDDEKEFQSEEAMLIGCNQPIYEGADLTSNQSLLLLMSFILKHQLTDDAVNDFLTIMNLHLPNVVPESKYLFCKKFNYQAFQQHYFCGDCTFYFGTSDQCDSDIQCSCQSPKGIEIAKRINGFSHTGVLNLNLS